MGSRSCSFSWFSFFCFKEIVFTKRQIYGNAEPKGALVNPVGIEIELGEGELEGAEGDGGGNQRKRATDPLLMGPQVLFVDRDHAQN